MLQLEGQTWQHSEQLPTGLYGKKAQRESEELQNTEVQVPAQNILSVAKLEKSRWSCPVLNIEHRTAFENVNQKGQYFCEY